MKNEKKSQFRDGLIEYIQEYNQNPDALNPLQRSRYFIKFYTERVLSVISRGLVPVELEELEHCLVDSSGDLGIDFISRMDGRVVIIQAKYHSKKEHKDTVEDKGEVERFCQSLERLYNHRQKPFKNPDLEEAVSDIDWLNDRFELYFISLSKFASESRDRVENGQKPIEHLPGIDDRTSIFLKDISDLNMDYRDALCYEEGIQEDVDVCLQKDENCTPWLQYKNGEGRTCYIGRISAKQIDTLVKRYRHRLFSLNIRNYLGELTTNKNISASAMNTPENFFFYNNGISAVASSIGEQENGILKCRGFSIINGSQTANSLVKACSRSRENAVKAEVLIRISEIHPKKDNVEEGFLDCITKYNNTQNTIKLGDFRSNDPIQISLKRYFGNLSLDGKPYCYLNKRDKDKSRMKIAIGMEDFAKTIHAFSFGPIDYYGGTPYLFDTSINGGYVKVFGDGKTVPDMLSKKEFEKLCGMWLICTVISENLAKEKKKHTSVESGSNLAKAALERRFLVYFVVGEFIRKKIENDESVYESLLRKLSDPNKFLSKIQENTDNTVKRKIEHYCLAAYDLIIMYYTRASKQQDFMQRNWFRQKSYLDELKEGVSTMSYALSTLPYIE